jgi:hypothetical protein
MMAANSKISQKFNDFVLFELYNTKLDLFITELAKKNSNYYWIKIE